MRLRRTLVVTIATAAATAGTVISAGLPAAPAQAATTQVQLPISQYDHMLIDPVHQHIFITSYTGSARSSSILVTDYSGNTVATIPNEPGATGLALSSDGSTVYAALATGAAVSAISTSTLTETARYATGTGTDPTYVAYTSGKIWFGYGATAPAQSGIGSIDPGTSPATVTLNATNDLINTWTFAPMLAATPSGELVAGESLQDPLQLESFNVSSGTAALLAAPRDITNADGTVGGPVISMQITPDGKDVVVASGAPYYHEIYRVSDLAPDGTYPTTIYPTSVSISSDGTVAAGTSTLNNEVFMFAPGASTPLKTYNFGSNDLAHDGVAVTPDGSELFAVTVNVYGEDPTLNIITDPAQVASTLSLAGPATDPHDQPVTVTGTLGGASPYTGGQTLQVTRIDPADPGGAALPDITTAADGSFSITDTPPKVTTIDTGTVTYQVSYAGDVHLSASTASVSVTVHYNAS